MLNHALLQASLSGDLEQVSSLLEAKADPYVQDEDNYTPLHLVAMLGHLEVLRVLAPYYNNMDVYAFQNVDDPDDVQDMDDGMTGVTPLYLACENGHDDVVQFLLDHNANMNMQDRFGVSPLSIAIQMGHENVVKLLIDRGPNLSIQDYYSNNSVVHEAVMADNSQILGLLIDANANLNLQNDDGETPLHLGVRLERNNCVMALVERGADLTMMNNDRLKALDLLPRNPHNDTPNQLIIRTILNNLETSTDSVERRPRF